MSVQAAIKRKTAPDIRARKNGEPIVMLTSYHAHTATLVDRLELQVGKDLQYIRINGTLVGGLVGLLIFVASKWIAMF